MNVVALLAHPDDELMCAGTLARLAGEGHSVGLLTMFVDDRVEEWHRCAEVLGVKLLERPPAWVDEDDFVWSRRAVRTVEEWVGHPDLLIGHRVEDPNTSHGHLGRVAVTLARRNRMSLWECDQTICGGLDPDARPPNHFVDITGVGQIRKAAAVACYASQLVRYPGLADTIDRRDRLYGWQVDMAEVPGWAEGFRVVKSVWL